MKAGSRFSSLLALLLVFAAFPVVIAADYSWGEPHAKVLPTGDLEWAPEPFTLVTGQTIRYIDYDNGADANDGTKAKPWKHHPWDPAATGMAKSGAADTFVFKGGVIYRGELTVPAGASARLTRDPSWAQGEARLYGSEIVGGWRRSAHPQMPQADTVWAAQLPFAPRNVYMVDKAGEATRLKLARHPNWEVSDPDNVCAEWWEWEQPNWWLQFQGKNENVMMVDGRKWHLGIDSKHLGAIGEDAVGGYVRTEWGVPTINTPYHARIRGWDPDRKGLAFAGPWNDNPGGMIFAGHRYYLEDRPQWLDQAGEFWFDKKGDGGTLYLWLPNDADPDTVTIEAAKRLSAINATDVTDLTVSGLSFSFFNVLWDLDTKQYDEEAVHAGVIRARGTIKRLQVDHCRFAHVHLPLRLEAGGTTAFAAFNDNDVAHADHGGCAFHNSVRHQVTGRGQKGKTPGHLVQIEALRNRMHDIGHRNARGHYGAAIEVHCAEVLEIAGNFLSRCAEQGIDVYGGKHNGETHDAPMSRALIHHNKVVDSLLMSSDWGGIETWQGGPFYVFNNISANPGGIMNWSKKNKGEGTPRFGFSFYTDGASKNYHFNNIAFGKNNTPGSIHANNAAFQSLIGFGNIKFNNTIYKFINGIRRQGTGGSRQMKYLGNVFQDIAEYTLLHHVGKGDVQAAHFNNAEGYDFRAMAYANNVLDKPGKGIGVIGEGGDKHETIEAMAAELKEYGTPASSVGKLTDEPLRDPANGDFRLARDSVAKDFGVTVFVPWSLYAMVGEWNFIRNTAQSELVIDEHWYMSEELVDRNTYQHSPRYHLQGVNIDADDYIAGALEDWAPGALSLNGKDQYLMISNEKLVEPFTPKLSKKAKKKGKVIKTFKGDEKATVNILDSNFIIEVYLKAESDGIIVRKLDAAGYQLDLDDGKPRLTITNQKGATATATAQATITDGAWHHVCAEVDRQNGITIYIDGKPATAEVQAVAGSLSNSGDFLVGGAPGENHLKGALDFLRISRGSLADAHTTIDELYTWQFSGPFLNDFTGRKRDFEKSAPGAIDFE